MPDITPYIEETAMILGKLDVRATHTHANSEGLLSGHIVIEAPDNPHFGTVVAALWNEEQGWYLGTGPDLDHLTHTWPLSRLHRALPMPHMVASEVMQSLHQVTAADAGSVPRYRDSGPDGTFAQELEDMLRVCVHALAHGAVVDERQRQRQEDRRAATISVDITPRREFWEDPPTRARMREGLYVRLAEQAVKNGRYLSEAPQESVVPEDPSVMGRNASEDSAPGRPGEILVVTWSALTGRLRLEP